MGWTHLRDATPKARKSRPCFCCGEPIGPGEAYVRRAGVRDGEFLSFAMHAECKAETDAWDDDAWACFSEGELDRPGGERARDAGRRGREIDARLAAEAAAMEGEASE